MVGSYCLRTKMKSLTPKDIIDMSLGANQGIINRRPKPKIYNPQVPINQASSSAPTGHNHDEEAGHGESPYQTPHGLQPELWSSIQRLNEMSPFGPNTVSVGSGYRSYEEQARLYNDWVNGVPGQAQAAPPGRSNHNHGTAADLEYLSPEAREWVHSVAADLGIHFPVPGENWHAELIG